jgi:hypothetical protein
MNNVYETAEIFLRLLNAYCRRLGHIIAVVFILLCLTSELAKALDHQSQAYKLFPLLAYSGNKQTISIQTTYPRGLYL